MLGIALDANGNTLADPSGKQYTWDFENRMTSAVVPGTGTVAFKYDPLGRRIQKSSLSGTINYSYDGFTLLEELDSAGNALARYAQGRHIDEPLAELRSGATSYYEQDGIDSVTSLTSGSGTIAATYVYDSFGRLSSSTGTAVDSFRYTGRELDLETGIYYYRARYYDPVAGRFLSGDPLGLEAGDNLYRYTENRPVAGRDPYGMCTIDVYFDRPDGASVGSHSFIVMTDPTVGPRMRHLAAVEFRSGPSREVSGVDILNDLVSPLPEQDNFIVAGTGEEFNQHSTDNSSGVVSSTNVLNNQCSCQSYRDKARSISNDINNLHVGYNLFDANSNSATTTILDGLGLSYPGTPPVFAPGWGNNLLPPTIRWPD